MARPARTSPPRKTRSSGGALPALPPGTPAWVMPELVADTLDCLQPHYANALTAADAVEILTTVARHPASRYAIIELSEPPKLVARTWFKVEDLIYYLDRQPDVPRRIVDFKRGVVLERDGKTKMRAVGEVEAG